MSTQKTYKNFFEASESAEYQSPAVGKCIENAELSDYAEGTRIFISPKKNYGYSVSIEEFFGGEYIVEKTKLDANDIKELEKNVKEMSDDS